VGPLARAGLLLCVLVAAGCGSDGPTGDDLQGSTARYDLVVTFWPEGKQGPSRTATLTCDPTGGTHPDPERACAALDAHPEALHPVPGDVACTEIYGGDQVAEVTGAGPSSGSLRAILNRTNGCEIARWDALAPVVELPA
jgi:hypothetical protein